MISISVNPRLPLRRSAEVSRVISHRWAGVCCRCGVPVVLRDARIFSDNSFSSAAVGWK